MFSSWQQESGVGGTKIIKRENRRGNEMNIFLYIVIILEIIVGVSSTLYLTVSLPAIIVYKIYRKAKYKISLFD